MKKSAIEERDMTLSKEENVLLAMLAAYEKTVTEEEGREAKSIAFRAMDALLMPSRGGKATKGVSTPAKMAAAKANGAKGGRPKDSNLFKVLDGIIDAKEYREANLADTDLIESYAEACGMTITTSEAKRIQAAGLSWLKKIENGGEWSRYRYEAKAELA